MKISLKDQAKISPALPMQCAATFTGSALPLEFVDIPDEIGGAAVVAVAATVTNADGAAATAPCEHAGEVWRVTFAASCFEHYGFVERGVSVALTLRDGSGNERGMVLAVGDLEVKRSSPSAAPGDPEKSYQIKGEDIFVKTRVIDDVQHYARQEMSYDAEMGAWGADWLGDYILVDGEFIPYEAPTGGGVTTAAVALLMLLAPFVTSAITATKEYVDRKDGEIAQASTNYTDSVIAEIPAPDFSTSNETLVATIEATAPVPSNYAEATMPARLRMSNPQESQYVEPISVLEMYLFRFPDMPGSPLVVYENGKWGMECEYGRVIGSYDSFDEYLTFTLPDAPFERYIFYVVYSPVATIDKVDRTAQALAGQMSQAIPPAVSNIVTKAFVENLGITSEETDPTVPQWAKAPTKPSYTASEVGATTPEDVTAAIREQSLGGIWDETLQVWWTPRMRNGSLTYEATTNVNLNAEN